jgi:hypothetical protein
MDWRRSASLGGLALRERSPRIHRLPVELTFISRHSVTKFRRPGRRACTHGKALRIRSCGGDKSTLRQVKAFVRSSPYNPERSWAFAILRECTVPTV